MSLSGSTSLLQVDMEGHKNHQELPIVKAIAEEDEGSGAACFLNHRSPERVLLLAMLVGVADEAMVVTMMFGAEKLTSRRRTAL